MRGITRCLPCRQLKVNHWLGLHRLVDDSQITDRQFERLRSAVYRTLRMIGVGGSLSRLANDVGV